LDRKNDLSFKKTKHDNNRNIKRLIIRTGVSVTPNDVYRRKFIHTVINKKTAKPPVNIEIAKAKKIIMTFL
jgi:hypothetical protein